MADYPKSTSLVIGRSFAFGGRYGSHVVCCFIASRSFRLLPVNC